MPRIRTLLPLALLSLLTTLFVAGCGGDDGDDAQAPAASGPGIALGSIFSTSGPGAAFGPQQLRAARLAVERVNADGGVAGERLRLVQRDDGGDPERTPEAMRDLIEQQGVLAVLGPTFSNAAATGDPIADELGTPVLAVSNTGPGIVGQCPYPCGLVFRDSLGEQSAIPANVRVFSDGHPNAAAAVVAFPKGDPFAKQSATIAKNALIANEMTVAEYAFEEPEDLDWLPGRPDVLTITASSGDVAAEAIRAARGGGYEKPILGGNAFNSRVAAAKAGAAGAGARSAAAWYAGNDSEANEEFVEAYREAYDSDPDQFAAQAYTGVLLLAEAARAAALGGDLTADRLALADALEGVEMETPLGPFRFTPDHDVEQPIWIVEMDGEGGFELVERVDPTGTEQR